MKKISAPLLPLLLLVFVGCKKVDIAFGSEFLDNENTQIIKVDSFGVDLSTVLIDSFATSAKGSCLVGSYTDPYFGKVTATTYFDIAPPTYTDIYQNTSFDSLILIGKINKNYYGDSTKPMHLDVFRLSEPIVPPSSTTNIYNVDSFAVFPTAVGSANLSIRPNATDTFSIRLSDVLGKEIMGMLQRKSDTVKNNLLFLEYLKGFRIASSTANAMIFGFADSVTMRLNYKQAGLFLENKRLDMTVSTTLKQFNNIRVDRSGTPLQALGGLTRELASRTTGNMAFSQPTSCVMAKIRFPSIKEVLKIPNLKKMLKAQLVIKPAKGSYSSFYSLPPQLRLSKTTQLNLMGDDLTTTASDGSAQVQYGSLTIDYLYGNDTYYTYDVTAYINEAIATDGYTQNGLLLLPPSPAYETGFNRVAIGDRNIAESKIELQIFYVTVQ